MVCSVQKEYFENEVNHEKLSDKFTYPICVVYIHIEYTHIYMFCIYMCIECVYI